MSIDITHKLEALNTNIRAKGLIDLVVTLPRSLRMIEIGSYEGQSSEIFATYFAHVTCVDPWESGYDPADVVSQVDLSHAFKVFRKRMKPYENVTVVKARSHFAADILVAEVDFVYIDGEHTYEAVKRDIAAWLPRVKPGGYIGGHDYSDGWPGVVSAVEESFGNVKVSLFDDTSWLVRL